MSESPKYFRIGAFVASGVAILVVGLIIFGAGNFFKQKIMFETYVNGTVQGLDVGSALKFRGVTVGKVTGIGFVFNEFPQQYEERREKSVTAGQAQSGTKNYVVVTMEMNVQIFPGMFREDLTELLKENVDKGLRMRIEPQGITGLNFMNIEYLKKEQLDMAQFKPIEVTWTPNYYYIPSAPGELTSMLDAANDIMRKMQTLDFEKIGKDVNDLVNRIDQGITDLDPKKLGKEASDLLISLQNSSKNLQKILKNIEPASKINAEQTNAIVSNLKTITDNLRTLSGNLKDNPSSLIFSRPPPKPKVYDSRKKTGNETR